MKTKATCRQAHSLFENGEFAVTLPTAALVDVLNSWLAGWLAGLQHCLQQRAHMNHGHEPHQDNSHKEVHQDNHQEVVHETNDHEEHEEVHEDNHQEVHEDNHQEVISKP